MSPVSRILLLFSLILLTYPADCLDAATGSSNETQILIDEDGYALANGEQRALYQGYSVVIKGVDDKGEKAWIELLQNGTSVSYGLFESEENFVYSKEYEIFNITIDHIYVGSQKDLVFFYVCQYRDQDLPDPAPLPDATLASNASSPNTATTPVDTPDPDSIPGCGAWVTVGVVLLHLASRSINR